jgi:hypothetical protein
VIAIENVVEMNYNRLLLFVMIIDFDKVVEYLLKMMTVHENYFDEVMVENLLVVIQTMNIKFF